MAKFRAKARAVELLGKGQIADLPTAISELWKNGYDAYGDNLEANLYMPGFKGYPDPIFTIGDDGKGMSREDILDRWFVLGTDSKTRIELDIKGAETLNKEPRIKTGEKGIGRLAVAYLGPQMLMVTKKINNPVQAVFFDWRILENYNLFLEDINIPLKTIDSVSSFQDTFQELKNEFLENFPLYKDKTKDPWTDQVDLRSLIIDDCNKLQVPDFIVEDAITDLVQNSTNANATRFIIFKPDKQVIELRSFTKNDETEDYKDDTSINHTVSTLVGLFNLFKTADPKHKTNFWIHESSQTGKYDLLSFKSFFSPADFTDSDHQIIGEFNENGEFKGSVRIYRQTVDHSFKPIRKPGRTNYGPFKINLGYVQPEEDATGLNLDQKRVFEEKLKLFSGLFIYRDGFRVLPYGRPDTDFLEFEERRSKGTGVYFFSKRRMFGYIEITRNENAGLRDKSSREGFINNAAFRDFKADLIAFFKDLAKKYFSTHAEYDYKSEQQAELKKLSEAAQQEHERDKQARKEFAKKLNSLPKELTNLENRFNELHEQLQHKSKDAIIAYDDVQNLLSEIEECRVQILDYKLAKPTRFKPTDIQKKNFHNYSKRYSGVAQRFDESSDLIRKVHDKLKVFELFKEFESQNEFYKNRLKSQFGEFEARLENIFNKINSEFSAEQNNFLEEFSEKHKSLTPSNIDAKEISRSMKLLEGVFKDSQERLLNRMNPYFEHLERLSFEVDEDNLVGYYKSQFEEMKEEWNKTYELAQLGIAVEIIDHQFNTLYSQLAEGIKSLKGNLQPTKEAESKFQSLDTAFEHLQDNYKLLQPLYRTSGRIRKNVTGKELKEYVEDFFNTRLNENKIAFSITPAAEKWTAFSYESIFKPVLINIVNNAIYWLQPVDKREIRIDVVDDKLLVMNSGVPIEDYMLDDVFKLFYSNRPKGRGIGLYLAKHSLNGIGYEIEATNDPKYNLLNGASFAISKIDH